MFDDPKAAPVMFDDPKATPKSDPKSDPVMTMSKRLISLDKSAKIPEKSSHFQDDEAAVCC